MKDIRTILCPVDLSPFSRREVELAVELAHTFGARLVLHHNMSATGFGLAKSWEWKQAHPSAGEERPRGEKLDDLVRQVPEDVPVESLMTSGPLAMGVASLAEQLQADLVLLGCHGCSSDDHTSLTEDLMGRCNCPILTIHEGDDREWRLHLGEDRRRPLRLLIPTDFSPGAQEAVDYAFSLAELLPAELHLLHVVGGSPAPVRVTDPGIGPAISYREAAQAEAEEKLNDLVPPHMDERCIRHLKFGRADEAIVRAAQELDPDLIVMGEHARDLVRRFLTRDTAKGVLHSAACPVWFVPPPRMVA